MNLEMDQLKQQLEYRKKFMERINDIHSATNLNDILIQLKDSIAGLFAADRMTIYVADTKRNVLISRVKSGAEVTQIIVPITAGSIAGYSALADIVVNIKDAYDQHELTMINTELKFDISWDQKTGYKTTQVLCVPMKFNNVLIGVIQLINKKSGEPFTEVDLGYANELASSLSIAIYNIHRLNASTKLIRQKSRYNYLLDKNLLEESDLNKFASHPDAAALGLDLLLMRELKIPREEMTKNLSLHFGTEFIAFDQTLPPLEDILSKIKPDRLKKERWVPVKVENGVLCVAMEDPTDLGKQDLINFVYPEYKRLSFVGAFRDDVGDGDGFFEHPPGSLAGTALPDLDDVEAV